MVPEEMMALISLFLFPGFLFLFLLAFFTEWLDRKIVAKLQNRYGPLHVGPKGILQPIADFIKLLSKEDITPAMADKAPFTIVPVLMLTLAITPLFCIPITNVYALVFFEGDLIVIMFIMSLTALLVFIGAWVSTNRFGTVSSIRAGLQMFGYEIPLNIAMIGPAIAAGSLSVSRIVEWQTNGFWFMFMQPLGFAVVSICLLAHLQKVPFDIPEAESEIVGGWMVEFSGKKLAFIRLASDFELVLAASLMVSLFLGGPSGLWQANPLTFLVKFVVCVFILSNLRALFARYRIDQLLSGSWKYLTPIALLQIALVKLFTW
ncbi:NADH-quinone oxidoreductase subunit H [Candidatus Bathyarchaeota archaeon]|nr:MAG: NADH-quinone oxidoreductase subunit H [Candidatus Bathyarchaeota archaeon]